MPEIKNGMTGKALVTDLLMASISEQGGSSMGRSCTHVRACARAAAAAAERSCASHAIVLADLAGCDKAISVSVLPACDSSTFGGRLKQWRLEAGLLQREVAEMLGESRTGTLLVLTYAVSAFQEIGVQWSRHADNTREVDYCAGACYEADLQFPAAHREDAVAGRATA